MPVVLNNNEKNHCFFMDQNHNNSLLTYLILLLTKIITDGELLVSKAKTFALGFFSPIKSTSRYVGIWYYNLAEQTVVWVENRDSPINDTSGVLSINPDGNLVLHHNYSTFPIWSTNVSTTLSNSTNVIAQLSDIANLILIQNNTKTVIWQSFDHPSDTLLPYQRLGFDRRTNQSWFLQSWKTDDDPGIGAFTLKFSTSGKPQLFMYKQDIPWWRGGPWNGELFGGAPNMKRDRVISNFSFVEDDNYVALSFNMFDKSVMARAVVQQSGFIQSFTWDNQKSQWNRYWSVPANQCDNYGSCGSNSNCDHLTADVRNGGSGCLAWHANLMDTVKLSDQGQDLFVRVDAVELVKFRYIVVGNEIDPNGALAQFVLPAMQNIYAALASANLQNQIKVSTAIQLSLLGSSYPPSSGAFSPSSSSYITPIVRFLANNGAPLLANLYTYFSYISDTTNIDLSYALFTSSTIVIRDGKYEYQNLFDASLGALYAALEKVGAPDLEVVVSESGWLSYGGIAATVDNARIYYRNLMDHVAHGTPNRPNQPIETYLFGMFDENQKGPAATE